MSGYRATPLSFNRKMVIASIAGNKKNAIHSLTEIDVTEPRQMIKKFFGRTGEKISFTAYLVHCFARVLSDYPELNAFIKGNQLILLDDVTVSVLVERDIDGEKVPEPVGIKSAQVKSVKQISDEIRSAQSNPGKQLGSLAGISWVRFIPGFLLKTFIRLADRNISLAKRYGKVAVTAVGMFNKSAIWFIPHGTATVLLTVGGISAKHDRIDKQQREYLHLTVSFDHEIVDGAPAARFMARLSQAISSGKALTTLNEQT